MVKRAFTLLELVLVIIVMAITAVIGTDVITHLYTGYMRSYSINRLESQTEIVLNQIVKRLQNRIKDSLIAVTPTGVYKALDDPTLDNTYTALEWIGVDNEGFKGDFNSSKNFFVPGWSALIDINSSQTSKSQVKTPGSVLSVADRLINALSDGEVNLTGASDTPALIFKGFYHADKSQFGWSGSGDHNYTYNVKRNGEDILLFSDASQASASKDVYERYALSWSAYAIVPVSTGVNDMNLTLYYNFQPWEGETYQDGKSAVLAEHVSSFRFKQIGQTLRVKLCIHDDNKSGFDFAVCKERAIF